MMKWNKMAGTVLAGINLVLIIICAVLYFRTDRREPKITFKTVETVYIEGMDTESLLEGAAAYDAEDGDLTERIVIERISENRQEDTVVVFYAVSDRAGNVARASRVFDAEFEDGVGQDDENTEGRFLEAGIAAELKEENVLNVELMDKAVKDMADTIGEAQEQETASPSIEPEPTPTPTPSQSPIPESTPESVDIPALDTTASHEVPVLILKTSEIQVSAGEGPAWVDMIETLSDDEDSYETLFRNLVVSRYDKNRPGSYQVTVYTEDSDGNQSVPVPLTIVVK